MDTKRQPHQWSTASLRVFHDESRVVFCIPTYLEFQLLLVADLCCQLHELVVHLICKSQELVFSLLKLVEGNYMERLLSQSSHARLPRHSKGRLQFHAPLASDYGVKLHCRSTVGRKKTPNCVLLARNLALATTFPNSQEPASQTALHVNQCKLFHAAISAKGALSIEKFGFKQTLGLGCLEEIGTISAEERENGKPEERKQADERERERVSDEIRHKDRVAQLLFQLSSFISELLF